jgi:hypothetical protein
MTMANRTILLCDDETPRVDAWASELSSIDRVREQFEIRSLQLDDFKREIAVLEKRRHEARTTPRACQYGDRTLIDQADLFIVDYDLIGFDDRTAEDVSYLARCYSRCGLIIELNLDKIGNLFDLTLRGHPKSFADLNIASMQVANPGLWSFPFVGYRPWAWPLLQVAIESFERRVDDVAQHLDDAILDYLGFPDEVVAGLSRSVGEFLSDQELAKMTFIRFIKESDQGLRRKDEVLNEEAAARIAVGRVSKWLENVLLPGQDILVDAPNLVSRYPSLLQGDRADLSSWNREAEIPLPNNEGGRFASIEAFRFQKPDWLSRAAWFWPQVSNSESIPEIADPWAEADEDDPDLVFCEDVSRFLPRGAAREFVARLSSPFVRRFVVDPKHPELEKLLGLSDRAEGIPDCLDVRQVAYQPALRFSL